MKEILFATNNAHKLKEVRASLNAKLKVISLKEANFLEEIPEPYKTLEENAVYKSYVLYQKLGGNVMADDTGLEVEALNGAPGVYSARYAGEPSNANNNMNKLLEALKGKNNKKAQFRTVASLIWEDKFYIFEGILKGKIIEEPIGTNGFGYDPIFVPDGMNKALAQLSSEEKNAISHRGLAFAKLYRFLNGKGKMVIGK